MQVCASSILPLIFLSKFAVKKGHTCSGKKCPGVDHCKKPWKHRYSTRITEPIDVDLLVEGQKESQAAIHKKQEAADTSYQFINEFIELGLKYFDVVGTPAGRASAAALASTAYAGFRKITTSANRNGGVPAESIPAKKAKLHSDFVIPTVPPTSPAGAQHDLQTSPAAPQHSPTPPNLAEQLQRTSTF